LGHPPPRCTGAYTRVNPGLNTVSIIYLNYMENNFKHVCILTVLKVMRKLSTMVPLTGKKRTRLMARKKYKKALAFKLTFFLV